MVGRTAASFVSPRLKETKEARKNPAVEGAGDSVVAG
jgi:hypothetical protein